MNNRNKCQEKKTKRWRIWTSKIKARRYWWRRIVLSSKNKRIWKKMMMTMKGKKNDMDKKEIHERKILDFERKQYTFTQSDFIILLRSIYINDNCYFFTDEDNLFNVDLSGHTWNLPRPCIPFYIYDIRKTLECTESDFNLLLSYVEP